MLSPRLHAIKEPITLPRSRLGSVTNVDRINIEEYESEQPGPIETTQQFLDWFSGIEGKMERDQEDIYRYIPRVDLISAVSQSQDSERIISADDWIFRAAYVV